MTQKGCLSEEGLQALVGGQLDETQRLEAAEHLAYCDRCMDRYTALLTADALETAAALRPGGCDGRDLGAADAEHMGTRRCGDRSRRAGADHVAHRYAGTDFAHRAAAEHMAAADYQQTEPELLGKPVNDKAPQPSTAPLGKPIEDKKQLTEKLSDALDALLHHSADTTEK